MNGSQHPFLDFCHSIAYDAHALSAFIKDPASASITDSQRTALLSGDWATLETALRAENPTLIKVQVQIDDLRLPDGSTNAGWVLKTLADQIKGGGWGGP